MVDVEDMIKCAIFLHRNFNELLKKGSFRDSKRLSENYVVSIFKDTKCVFNEIDRSALEIFINTKQVDDDSILSLQWNFWNTV